ncbi:MAG: hypothetical protein ACXWPG_00315 [Ktedonobacteraceae bacterium]
MSTRNADLEKEQNASQGAPGTIFNEDTIQLEKASPPPNAPQPPKHTAHNRRNFWLAITAVVIVMALIFSVLAVFIVQPGKQPGTQVTPTATAPSTTSTTTPGSDTTPAPAPGVTNGPQNGPSDVNTAAYWDTILGTKDTNGKVESVSFANVMGNSTLQALVTVRHSDANSTLDVYVFDKITSKNPVKIFTLDGLMKGQAKISYYNSIMTAEVDQNSTVNAGKTVSQMTPDLYREFAWSNGSMAQVAFPGIFPDLTRYQAEADQARVNAGHDPWKNDPKQVSLKFVGTYINWKYPLTATVTSGGGSHDVNATVKVQQEVPGIPQGSKPSLTVTLSRLEGNTHNMWVVIALDKGSALLTSIQPRSLVASPVKLEGKGSTFEQDLGEAYILDHTYTKVGHAHLTSTPNKNDVPYSVLVSYATSFKAGPQEGIVEVQQSNPMGTGPVPVVMVKVLLDPQPRVALGPIFCPLALQNGAGPLGLSGLKPSCGNLKGNASLQALVVRDGSATVFDNITNARPTQIFTMKTQYASISGVSTIITKDGDLYREFKWSGTAGTFEQVVFPGMFPDMTRWQAEQSQSAVMQGQDTWRLDPVQTTQHWALLGGTAKLVKGGGPNDLTAVVNVTYPDKGGPTTNIPVTQVTLSRLDGKTTGIWEITSVGSNWLLIYTPKSGSTINSPVTVTGFGPQFEAQVGVVYILDRLYKQIQVGNNFAMAPDGSSPPSKFSLDVKYTSSLTGGTQEGIVELAHSSGASFAGGVVMVKVLINPTPTTSIQDPAYWTQFVSVPPAIRVADSVSFGHLLGKPSLQAVVVARDILGGGPVYSDVFVFDNINASQPKLLWHESSLLHGDAKISAYNTVMTAQVDVNSSINKGKMEAALTTDLFREFNWSNSAGTFVQVAFPGFFPDMTRWQAEAVQTYVNAGQGAWRNDAVLVTKTMVAQFFNWQRTVTTKVLSGGGPNDVYATLQVQEAPIQGGSSVGPTVLVTLSRLEGNTHNIWEVIAAKDGTRLTLTNIPAGSLISSPVTLTGTGSAYEAVIGQGVVYDHLNNTIGHAQLTGSPGMGKANYSIKVPYTSSFKGAQEGIVAAYQGMGGLSNEYYSAVMVKVLIGG